VELAWVVEVGVVEVGGARKLWQEKGSNISMEMASVMKRWLTYIPGFFLQVNL
jgi:hypothetical protein